MSFTFNDTALFLLVGTTRSGNSDCLIIYLGETWSLPKKRDAMHYMHLCNAHLVCLKQLPWPFRIEHYASVSELSISPISIFFRFRFRLRGRFDVTKYLCSHKDLSLSYYGMLESIFVLSRYIFEVFYLSIFFCSFPHSFYQTCIMMWIELESFTLGN